MYSDIPLEISWMDVKGNVASSDRLRLQNNLGLSSAVDIQRASSLMPNTFPTGLSPRFENPATAWAQWLSLNSGLVHGFPLKCSSFGKTETFPSRICNHSIAETSQNPWLAVKVTTPHGQNLISGRDSIICRNVFC